jgi:hypothetical protein
MAIPVQAAAQETVFTLTGEERLVRVEAKLDVILQNMATDRQSLHEVRAIESQRIVRVEAKVDRLIRVQQGLLESLAEDEQQTQSGLQSLDGLRIAKERDSSEPL